MTRFPWLQRLRGLFRGTQEVRRQLSARRTRRRPRLEALEDRTLLSFSQPILSNAGVAPYGIAVADLDGDGHLDVVTVNSVSNTVSILYGHGDGTFAAPLTYSVGNNPQHVAIGSLRGNGLLDLVVSNYVQSNSNDLTILLNNGDGTFSN